jgi:2-hydroxychromene-2-carboxylate isomerase
MRGLWAQEQDIADDATLVRIADDAGFDGEALLQASHSAAAALQYERNTEDALAAGVFGVPWYVVDGKGYWGQDRLDFLGRALSQ